MNLFLVFVKTSLLTCLMLGFSLNATAQKPPVPPVAAQADKYTRAAPSADGIGKSYMGREIAGVMGWQAAAWLEREEREQEERGDLLLRELGDRKSTRLNSSHQ